LVGLLCGCQQTISSGDGLGITVNNTGKIVGVKLDDQNLPTPLIKLIPLVSETGFFVHEEGSLLDREPLILGQVKETEGGLRVTGEPIGIKLVADFQAHADAIVISGSMNNLRKSQRRITLGLSLPANASGWFYGHSLVNDEVIKDDLSDVWKRYTAWVELNDGSRVNAGLITPIFGDTDGIAAGISPATPLPFRISYKQDEGLTLEADLDLGPAVKKGKSGSDRGDFEFVIFRFDPKAGYRSALAKFYRIAPGDYTLHPAFSLTQGSMDTSLAHLARGRELAGATGRLNVKGGANEVEAHRMLLFAADSTLPGQDAWHGSMVDQLLSAGWEPCHGVVVAESNLLVERYGGKGDSTVFYAVHNSSDKPLAFEMAIDLTLTDLPAKDVKIVDRTTGKAVESEWMEGDLRLVRGRISAGRTALFAVERTD
jgi:hypothetical protein